MWPIQYRTRGERGWHMEERCRLETGRHILPFSDWLDPHNVDIVIIAIIFDGNKLNMNQCQSIHHNNLFLALPNEYHVR